MSNVTRDLMPTKGAKFYDEGGKTLFVYVIDASSVFGPRPAQDQDKVDHPEAWRRYNEGLKPLADLPTIHTDAASEAAPPKKGRRGRPPKQVRATTHDASDNGTAGN